MAFPGSYVDQLNFREGPLHFYIVSLLKDARFVQKFAQFTNITIDNVYTESNFGFMTGLVTGLLWGDAYFNTNFKIHKPLFGLNFDILHNEKQHCEKLLTWLFRITETIWKNLAKELRADFASKMTNLSIISSIVEELRMVHLDEDALSLLVDKISKQLSLAFHVVQHIPDNQLPALPHAINA